jgi:hypothetical protein
MNSAHSIKEPIVETDSAVICRSGHIIHLVRDHRLRGWHHLCPSNRKPEHDVTLKDVAGDEQIG